MSLIMTGLAIWLIGIPLAISGLRHIGCDWDLAIRNGALWPISLGWTFLQFLGIVAAGVFDAIFSR